MYSWVVPPELLSRLAENRQETAIPIARQIREAVEAYLSRVEPRPASAGPEPFGQSERGGKSSCYSYATAMNGSADQGDLRLRFDVLTKRKQPELHRYSTTRDRATNLRLFRLVSEILHAIEAGVFHLVAG
ncbi:MAG: hypothetical protein ACE5JN_15745 [Candidatus Methylomirabilia bacterium]